MPQPIRITDSRGEEVGSISFTDNLTAHRTAEGFKLILSATVLLKTVAKGQPIPVVSDVWATLTMNHTTQSPLEVGRIQAERLYSSAPSDRPNTLASLPTSFMWWGTLSQLAVIEKLREGRVPEFQIDLWGQVSYLLAVNDPRHQIRSDPHEFYDRTTISYPKETWLARLRSIGVLENVLVEIPLPPSPSPDWQEVWNALVEARNSFEQGGSTGWKGCVVAVRLALEKWQKIEPEQHGQGWKSPSPADRQSRSWRERLDNVRWHLLQCAHDAAHSAADEWTRDDAILMLAALSALLAERKP